MSLACFSFLPSGCRVINGRYEEDMMVMAWRLANFIIMH